MSEDMTYEELTQLPFRFAWHLNMDNEHITTYVCAAPEYADRISFCDHTPYKDGRPKGRSYRHWMVDGKVYKSKKKLIEAIKEL